MPNIAFILSGWSVGRRHNMDEVVIVEDDLHWPALFAEEEARLRSVLDPALIIGLIWQHDCPWPRRQTHHRHPRPMHIQPANQPGPLQSSGLDDGVPWNGRRATAPRSQALEAMLDVLRWPEMSVVALVFALSFLWSKIRVLFEGVERPGLVLCL